MGNIYAAQLFESATQNLGDLENLFASGNFTPLVEWLRENVHTKGGTYKPRDLIKNATGTPPDPKYLVSTLEKKYSKLYNL